MTDEDECSICLAGALECSTTCGHRFCRCCMESWLARHATCPLCMAPVYTLRPDRPGHLLLHPYASQTIGRIQLLDKEERCAIVLSVARDSAICGSGASVGTRICLPSGDTRSIMTAVQEARKMQAFLTLQTLPQTILHDVLIPPCIVSVSGFEARVCYVHHTSKIHKGDVIWAVDQSTGETLRPALAARATISFPGGLMWFSQDIFVNSIVLRAASYADRAVQWL